MNRFIVPNLVRFQENLLQTLRNMRAQICQKEKCQGVAACPLAYITENIGTTPLMCVMFMTCRRDISLHLRASDAKLS